MHSVNDFMITLEQEMKLVEEAKQSPEGFGRLYDAYFQMIFNYILKRTGDFDLAQDFCSETFIKVLHNLPKFKFKGAPFSSWLYRIATNEINQHFRKNKLLYFDFLQPSEEPVAESTPDEEVKSWEDERQKNVEFTLMLEYVKKLNVVDQSIISLRYFENLKFSEIGVVLDLNEGTVKVRMNRALTKLQRWMKGA